MIFIWDMVKKRRISPDLDRTLDEIFANEIDFQWPSEDDEPDTEKMLLEFVKCPDCKGSGTYVGIGLYPPEKCSNCLGDGKILKD